MQNRNSSARTAAQKSSKCSLLFRQAPILAILMLVAVCFSSCKSNFIDDYDKKCLELDLKKKELDYLKQLYSVKSDIEFSFKIKKLDSLINDAARSK